LGFSTTGGVAVFFFTTKISLSFCNSSITEEELALRDKGLSSTTGVGGAATGGLGLVIVELVFAVVAFAVLLAAFLT